MNSSLYQAKTAASLCEVNITAGTIPTMRKNTFSLWYYYYHYYHLLLLVVVVVVLSIYCYYFYCHYCVLEAVKIAFVRSSDSLHKKLNEMKWNSVHKEALTTSFINEPNICKNHLIIVKSPKLIKSSISSNALKCINCDHISSYLVCVNPQLVACPVLGFTSFWEWDWHVCGTGLEGVWCCVQRCPVSIHIYDGWSLLECRKGRPPSPMCHYLATWGTRSVSIRRVGNYFLLLYSFLTLFYYCCTTISLGINKVFLNLESWMRHKNELFLQIRP